MPFGRIDMLKGKPAEYRAAVADVVYHGIVEALGAPEGDRFVVVHEHEPDNFFYDKTFMGYDRSPDVVFIQVMSTVGNTTAEREKFFSQLAEQLSERVGLRRDDTMMNLVFIQQEDWSFGGGVPWRMS